MWVLIFWDILAEWLILARLQHAARSIFFNIEFLTLLVWILSRRWVWYLLREECHVVFAAIFMMRDFGHLIGTNLLMCVSSWIWTPLTTACRLSVIRILSILAIDLKHMGLILSLILATIFNMLTILLVTVHGCRLLRVRVEMCLVICLHRIHIDCIIINCFSKIYKSP